MYACMMLFFISNAVEGQLISTGAFEVSYNGAFGKLFNFVSLVVILIHIENLIHLCNLCFTNLLLY